MISNNREKLDSSLLNMELINHRNGSTIKRSNLMGRPGFEYRTKFYGGKKLKIQISFFNRHSKNDLIPKYLKCVYLLYLNSLFRVAYTAICDVILSEDHCPTWCNNINLEINNKFSWNTIIPSYYNNCNCNYKTWFTNSSDETNLFNKLSKKEEFSTPKERFQFQVTFEICFEMTQNFCGFWYRTMLKCVVQKSNKNIQAFYKLLNKKKKVAKLFIFIWNGQI